MARQPTTRSPKPTLAKPPSGEVFGHTGVTRVGLYGRVSTDDQQTLPMQIEQLQAYAARRGWSVVLVVEEVASGVKHRAKRETLLQAARRRELDAVLVWRLDRWGRSLADLVTTLEELRALEVGFVSLTEALDLTTPAGRALAGMMAVFAQFERDLIRERVKAGIAHARAQGRALGRPRTAASRGDRVRDLDAQGFNHSQIARELGMGRTSVRRILTPG
jgi:putative DNA-invertase from lambdoid prophage Rac